MGRIAITQGGSGLADDGKAAAATVELYDAQVRLAWAKRKLSDGTRLDVGLVDMEQMFAVTPTGTFAVVATSAGWRRCDDGSEQRATVANLKAFVSNAGGHTHPLGRNADILADLPGPEDGRMARATGKPAYVIARRRAFSIREAATNVFDVRVIAGSKFSKAEQARIEALKAKWNQHGGGSGVQCRFDPD